MALLLAAEATINVSKPATAKGRSPTGNDLKSQWQAIRILAGILTIAVLLAGCQGQVSNSPMHRLDDRASIQKIIESYTKASESGDAGLWESLYWLDDANFTEIENDRPGVLDRRYIEQLGTAIRTNGPSESNQRWYDTKVYLLSPDSAYSVSLRDEINTATTSRVTLIYQKKGSEWRIIHAHFSDVPK